MTEWIDFSVYAALMLVVWFGVPAMNRQFILPIVEDRNPEWLAAQPEAVRALTATRWFLWPCYVAGALSVATLLWGTHGARRRSG